MKLFTCSLALILILAAICPIAAASDAAETAAQDISVAAKSAVLIDAASNSVIYEKNSGDRLPMASTTKIMTALVAIESPAFGSDVTVDAAACGVEGSSVYLREGEHFTMEELLYALLLNSANDAATQIAIATAGSVEAFADLMNEKAAELGLTDTHFTNPHGLDNEEHYTSARDLAIIASAALRNPTFRQICSTYRHTIGTGESTRYLLNHNRMLKLYKDAIGVKTGFTKRSGRCLVSAAERDGVMLVAVTLSDPDDWRDHEAMLDYGFSRVESVSLCSAGSVRRDIPCTGGDCEAVRISNRDALDVTLPTGHGEITVTVTAGHILFAPVAEGDALGTAIFSCDGRELGRCTLYAENGCEYIEQKGFFERLFDLYR